ncbi:hypothetical protein ASPNIDRAFT_39370 [Aspergillus niger ATCC 1015]|uniref:Zn(2)-C6 fungal-type domain-containing protein n=1 Tax=Aspergillus niger (strain ATCC 1015 / CBS 113.46 / FGSC A1144 / LSHB Ac4 / NCTC 3858a / NRRL 328 / USDA 3528.7) TaxID=380704 RepID=G3YB86_ASPNA|nr:hypothetical protein ASPNIDRAFT_39370 [Aspergillus niger ATCC 1015]
MKLKDPRIKMIGSSSPSTTVSLADNISRTTSRRKTRDSCDGCAKSKVRCGKQHPRCDRCVARKQACNYGLIRPKGRPRLSHRSPSLPAVKSQPCSPDPCIGLDLLSTSYDPESTADSHIYCSPETKITSTTSHLSCDIQNLGDWKFLDHELNLPFDITTPQSTFTSETVQSDNQMDSVLSPTLSLLHSSRASSPCSSDTTWHVSTCLPMIVETLGRLDYPLEYYIRQVDVSQLLSLDTVLRLNEDAMSNFSAVLECHCRVASLFAPSIAEAITKILTWYAGIISDCKVFSSHSSCTFVEFPPIKIGEFELGKSDSKRMVIQVVMTGLNKVQALVQIFACRYCRHDDLANDNSMSICLALEARLRGELNDIRNYAVLAMAG